MGLLSIRKPAAINKVGLLLKKKKSNLDLKPAVLFLPRSSQGLDGGKGWRRRLWREECGLKERKGEDEEKNEALTTGEKEPCINL